MATNRRDVSGDAARQILHWHIFRQRTGDFGRRHFGDWRIRDTHDTIKDATTLLIAKFGYGAFREIHCRVSAEAWMSRRGKDHECHEDDQTHAVTQEGHHSPLFPF